MLNELVDILEKEAQAAKNYAETSSPSEKTANGPKNPQANGVKKEPLVTWVHKNFQVCFLFILLYSDQSSWCFTAFTMLDMK